MDPVTTAALIGAGSSFLSGTASGLFKPSLKRQWKYKQKEMALQQQYALEQMDKQAVLNYQNWQKQFDYENAYNDPSKVFDRYLKAGVTPAAVLGSSGVGVNATMSGGSAGSVGASGPSGGSFDFSNPVPPMDFAGSAASMMMAESTSERNKAAANRDNAEAQSIQDQNVGSDRYKAMADARVALDNAIASHNLTARDVLQVQESIEKNNLFISDTTLMSAIDEKKNQAALVAAQVKNLGIENDSLGRLMSAQSFMMETQARLNQVLGQQASETIESLKLNNLDMQFELARNWDKRFTVNIPNPQYDKNLRSNNPIQRANPGPKEFAVQLSLKDYYDKVVVNQGNASDFLPEDARIALRNAKLDPYVEILKSLLNSAGSLGSAFLIGGRISGAARTVSAAASSTRSVGNSTTTRYDSRGNVVGYATTEMTRSGYGNRTGYTQR